MIETRIVKPHENETYRVGVDDKCLIVASGSDERTPIVWLSKSMINWIAENGLKEIESAYKNA